MKQHGKLLAFIFLIAGFYVCLTTAAYGLFTEISGGIAYLSGRQNSDGSWDGGTAATANGFLTTCEASITLSLLDPSSGKHINGFNYIIANEDVNVIYLAKKILALKYTSSDYSVVLSELLSLQREDGGFGGDSDSYTDILNTAVALQILKTINYADQTVINNAISYIMSNQNLDGGL